MLNLTNPVRVAIYCYSEGVDSDFIAYQRYVVQQDLAGRLDRTPVVSHYADDGVCSRTEVRPNFQRLLIEVAAGAVDCVAVTEMDRLSNDLDGASHLARFFQRHGVLVVECLPSKGIPVRAAA
ncbi:recombinase family protein [Lysobacter antibioticus]|uniref:recombinase family protein n=1 Tax=Lysobacter antibioticus TaxID=84531 RepID=UPI0007173D4D|nr:recombinase family protein [Lysobacter antibioticus]